MTKKLDSLRNMIESRGYGVLTYSPGDGPVRYRFYKINKYPADVDFFALRDYETVTALGFQEAKMVAVTLRTFGHI